MPEELTWDLLVHPFFSLGIGWQPLLKFGGKILYQEQRIRNAKVLGAIWRRRILEISRNPERGMVIFKPDFE